MSQGRNGHHPGGKPPLAEEVQAKELRVLKLRRSGLTFDAIASSQWQWPPGAGETRRLYSDKSAAHKAYKAALDRAYRPDVTEARQLEDGRLDDLLAAVYPKALRGDVGAANTAIRIGERRARLWGLDHADGIAERLVQIEADKVRLMAVALVATLDELGITEDEIRARFKRVFVRHLRAVTGSDHEEPDDGDDGSSGALVPA